MSRSAAQLVGGEPQGPAYKLVADRLREAIHEGGSSRDQLPTESELMRLHGVSRQTVRRAYLDLTGTIPSAEQARPFLKDHVSNKRQVLIDRLLASPEHARHLATVFGVMLMERRPDRHVPADPWREFLRASFAANKP